VSYYEVLDGAGVWYCNTPSRSEAAAIAARLGGTYTKVQS